MSRYRLIQMDREMVPPTGIEPVTVRLEGGCSIRLSYGGDATGGPYGQCDQGCLRLVAKLSE